MSTKGKEHKRQGVGKLVNPWPPGEEAEVEVECLACHGPTHVTQANISVNKLPW
jgi:hypothetical protein